MRRELLTVLAIVMLVGALFGPSAGLAPAEAFSDVGTNDWFYTAVEQLSAAGVVTGFTDGSFRPFEPVSRAQFAAMMARALDPPQVYQEPFEDVRADDWFYFSVASLYQAGLISGTSSTTFSPSQNVDRQQTATLVIRALRYMQAEEDQAAVLQDAGDASALAAISAAPEGAPAVGGDEATASVAAPQLTVPLASVETTTTPLDLDLTEAEMEAWLAGFKDRLFIDPAHRPGVANAYRYGVVSGSGDGWFYPTFSLTRAQAAGMLYQALFTALRERPAFPDPVPAVSSYPELKQGSTGVFVAFIETRLNALKYDVGRQDGVYDEPLRDAVRAFQKVEGLSRDGTVGAEVWARIGKARVPSLRYSTGGDRVEIDLSRQVLFLVNGGSIVKILPIASGAPGYNTPTGHYYIQRKLPYWRRSALGLLYKPSYFVGGIAIHGSYSIPPYPASHGCVRVPVWATDALYPQLPVGMPVDVYY